ncbi:hypothetical protein SLS58_006297 [Diplodia intermedia]|uniref:Uncharacterized protein n=1 Tax=Diplodia intermedia TaxID=856260 RepID=A0ABR3TP46_9PEZI
MSGRRNKNREKGSHSSASDEAKEPSSNPPATPTPQQQHVACASQVPLPHSPPQAHPSPYWVSPPPKLPETAKSTPGQAPRPGLATRGHSLDNLSAASNRVSEAGVYNTNVYRQAPAMPITGYPPAGQPSIQQTLQAASSISHPIPSFSSLQHANNETGTQKGKKKAERALAPLSKAAADREPTTAAPPPSKPAWTGKPEPWLEKARQASTAKVIPVIPVDSPRDQQPLTTTKQIPKFKRLAPADIVPFRFVNIEPLSAAARSRQAAATATAGLSSTTSPEHAAQQQQHQQQQAVTDHGWRGHPGVIVGIWDGLVGVVGTTSWGGKGADLKFDRAGDRALYKKSFFPISGESEYDQPTLTTDGGGGDVAAAVVATDRDDDRMMMRVDGPMAFAANTVIDGRAVRFIPATVFCDECSRYFRHGTREEVFLAPASARRLEEQLFYLAGLTDVPWKAADHEGLKRWRAFKEREGFAPTEDVPMEDRIA